MGPTELMLVLLALSLYFLPAIVAHRRGHHNASAITVLTLFLGWTAIGWIVALVWAYTATAERAQGRR
jgi:hypothetical protein